LIRTAAQKLFFHLSPAAIQDGLMGALSKGGQEARHATKIEQPRNNEPLPDTENRKQGRNRAILFIPKLKGNRQDRRDNCHGKKLTGRESSITRDKMYFINLSV
jgi:hypothetical protein